MAQAGQDKSIDAAYLRTAIDLAAKSPAGDANPRVGALILGADGTVAATGYHLGAGTPHAEVVALSHAGERARGGTAYVSLEPCGHTGRTGPCTQALLDAGIARVVYAQRDPNPLAAGGAETLEAAGVAVTRIEELAEAAFELNRPWTHAMATGRPYVTWKFAATLDGYSAAADGSSRWITSERARADVHARRAACGAILVGTGTVLADDPHLTARDAQDVPVPRQPLRVVMGLRDIPAAARVRDDAAETLIMATRDPLEVLTELGRREIRHVWLEGGPTLAAFFLRAGLVDEILGYVAPALLGAGRPVISGLGIESMAEIARLTLGEVTRIGPDLRITARPPVLHRSLRTASALAGTAGSDGLARAATPRPPVPAEEA